MGEKEWAQGIIPATNTDHTTLGIRVEIASDGGSECTASATKGMLREDVSTTSRLDTVDLKSKRTPLQRRARLA